jgi:hypothetical protein
MSSNVDLTLKQTYRDMLLLSNNIDSFSNNTAFLGHLSIASNLYISGLSNILGNTSFISDLYVSNISNIYNNITTLGNFYISTTSNLYNLTTNSNLYISNNTLLINNTNIIGNLNISTNTIINNNITINNNLFISNISLLNNTTINSTLQASNAILNLNSSINSNLFVSNISIINIHLTSNSNLYVSNNTILNNNTTILSNLYTSNLNIKQNMTTLNSIEITGNTYFNKDITIYKNMTVSNNLLISGLSTLNNLNITGTITTILPEYEDNLSATNNNIPLWGFYRTGGILKIRVDTLAPSMTGNTTISVFKGTTYTDPGISVIDNLNEIIIPKITSINYSGYNYLSSPITISGPMAITSFNSLLVGSHTITYTASDSYSNISNIYRIVNVALDSYYPYITLNGNDVMKIKVGTTFTEQSVTVYDYNVVLNTTGITTLITPTITGTVNNNEVGKYILSYNARDISGNISNTLYRTVYVLNTSIINSYNITNSYLYLSNNYNILTTSLFWTIEGWFYITSLSNNGCTIIDFRNKPYTSNTGKIAFLINSSGYLGMYYESSYTYTSISIVPLNTWNHIAIQKNGIYFEFYLNGTFVGQIAFNGTLLNFNQLTLGMKNDLSNTDTNYHFKGSISQVKITSSLVYLTSFYPNNDLLSTNNVIFFLGDNLKDTITNTTLNYDYMPTNSTREYFINLPVSNLESRNLVFNLKCQDLIVSNVSPTSLTWTDTTNNYQFICHPNANTISSLSKVQNNNAWKRTGNIAWTMSDSSNTLFKSLNWTFGLSLEQWIYIDYDFIPSSTRMLLVGQSSMFNTNDYGFCFAKEYYPFNSFPYNVLSFATTSPITNQGNGMGAINLRALVGKWTHLCVTISQINSYTKILKLYVNGGLLISLDSSTWTVWCDPSTSTSKFTIGCNSNNGTIQSESLNKIHFGNTRVYNRILDQDEVYNNYNYESNLYQIQSYSNSINYNIPISWTFYGGTSTIITNEYIQTINIEPNKYIFKNYSVSTNSVYKINLIATLQTATNICISITDSSGTFNTIGGYEFTPTNSGLNQTNFINLEYIFETKLLSSVNIYIGNHNQSDIASQTTGTFSILDFQLNKYDLIISDVVDAPNNIDTPINWNRPDGTSTSIITNGNIQTLYFDDKKYYITIPLIQNTAYIVSFWLKLGTTTNFCLSLRNGISDLAWDIGGYEFTTIKNGLTTTTFTKVSYIFDSKNYISLSFYVGTHLNSMASQVYGTATIADFKIIPIIINPIISLYNPISNINFITPVNTIASDPIINYDFTTGWLSQTIDLNILRIVPSWTIEVFTYATSWGSTDDSGYIFDFSSGSNSFILGITSSVNNVSPTTSYDGNGRPFIYYNGDSVLQWKVKSTPIVSLNTWNHIVYQKNNDTQLEIFVNGISTGTFTVSINDWRYPNFMSTIGINNIVIGASNSEPYNTLNHWKGKLSQPKITLGKKYSGTFTPQFDLSINDNGLFLLQDNFINNAIGKSMINNTNVIIPSYSDPTLGLLDSNPYKLLLNTIYNEPGYYYDYYTRTNKLKINVSNNINVNILGKYNVIYSIYDNLNNINYVKRIVNIVSDIIPPVITLIGDSFIELYYNNVYNELGIIASDNSGGTCILNIIYITQNNVELLSEPININNSSNYITTDSSYTYYITYSATDPSGNIATKVRTVLVSSPDFILYQKTVPISYSSIFRNNTNFIGGYGDCAYGNGKYISISISDYNRSGLIWDYPVYIIYTTNKIDWYGLDITSVITSYPQINTWYRFFMNSITFGNNMWYISIVALFNNYDNKTFFISSVDGVSWTFNTTPRNGPCCTKYVNDAFFEVYGTNRGIRPIAYISRSTDFISWTPVSNIYPNNPGYGSHDDLNTWGWRVPIYGNGIYLTISSYYNNREFTNYLTSTDGITWTNRDFSQILMHPYVVFGNNKFFIYADNIILSSIDGINWTRETNSSTQITNNQSNVGFVKNTFISVSRNYNTNPYSIIMKKSSDGLVWSNVTLPYYLSFSTFVELYTDSYNSRRQLNIVNNNLILNITNIFDRRTDNTEYQNRYDTAISLLSYNGQYSPMFMT